MTLFYEICLISKYERRCDRESVVLRKILVLPLSNQGLVCEDNFRNRLRVDISMPLGSSISN